MKVNPSNVLDSNQLLNSICKAVDYNESQDSLGRRKIDLIRTSGQGSIDQMRFNNQLTVINFDVNLSEDLTIEIPNHKNNILYFFYTLEGICYHSFDNTEKFSKIDELKTVAVASSRYNHNILVIKKGIPFKCNLLTIDRDQYVKNFECDYKPENKKLEEVHTIFEMLRDYLFECSHNLKITEQLRSITNILQSESVSTLVQLQSRYQLILSHHIEQLYKETFEERENTNISRSEIQKIRTITEYIIDNPGLNHSQDILCSQFFVSQSKLQNGFKEVHNMTVSNFTRKVRLDKAKELLQNSDLNVSEIVYTVGFTSRSYFSKIFKLEFGCNPTAYKSKHRMRQLDLAQ